MIFVCPRCGGDAMHDGPVMYQTDAELVDELVKVRHAFVSKLDRVYNLQDIAFMMVAYAIARKETIK